MKLELDTIERIIENLHDGLYLVDTNRIITYWNKAAAQISGFAASEVVGKSCADNILTHVDMDGKMLCTGMCPLAGTMADGHPREAQVYMHHKDGHRIPVSVRATPLTDKNGNVIGAIELFTDISTQAGNGIVRNVNAEDLTVMGNRLRTLIENAYILHQNNRLHVTVSIGATLGKAGDTIETLIKRADTLLYQSKADGRNR